jgi:hypothetical protein
VTISKLFLALLLSAAVALWWPSHDDVFMGGDDVLLLRVSHEIAAGHWGGLLTPQSIHVLPLYRLVRLYFDVHFPDHFQWLHAVVVLAHLASVWLLYVLSRRFFASAAAALAAATLFAWHALGAEAFIVKSQSTFVLSLPFLLGGLYCLVRRREAAAGLCLAAAVGLHSMGAVAALPGVLLGYYLAPRGPDRRRESDSLGAWLAVAAAVVLGVLLWLGWGMTIESAGHIPGIPAGAGPLREILLRCGLGLQGVLLHFGFLVRRAPPGPAAEAACVAGLAALLFLLRRRPAGRWVVTALAMAVPPAFATFFLRDPLGYHLSRYSYQSFVPLAVAAGAALDLALEAVAPRPAWRRALCLALICLAPLYYVTQRNSLRLREEALRLRGSLPRQVWIGWRDFLSAQAARGPRPFRIPDVRVAPDLALRQVVELCFPEGNPGLLPLTREQTRAADCAAFAEALEEAGGGPVGGQRLVCRGE